MPASNAAHCIEDRGDVLLLGMVFAHRALEPKRGQEFRDRVRCEAVKSLGYNVFSLDDKHPDTDINEHCRANFADKRRMLKAMHSKWEAMPAFKHIVLDYFFSPVSLLATPIGESLTNNALCRLAGLGLAGVLRSSRRRCLRSRSRASSRPTARSGCPTYPASQSASSTRRTSCRSTTGSVWCPSRRSRATRFTGPPSSSRHRCSPVRMH